MKSGNGTCDLHVAIAKTGSRVLRRVFFAHLLNVREFHIRPSLSSAPSSRLLPDVLPPVFGCVVTMVRQPAARLASEFAFLPRRSETLSQFANHSYRRNWQVAVLSGLRQRRPGVPTRFRAPDDDSLNRIVGKLREGSWFCGVFEKYAQSVRAILASRYCWSVDVRGAAPPLRGEPTLPQASSQNRGLDVEAARS